VADNLKDINERRYSLSPEQLENWESTRHIERLMETHSEVLGNIFTDISFISSLLFHTVCDLEKDKAKIEDCYDLFRTLDTIISKALSPEHERHISNMVGAELAHANGEDWEHDDGYPDSATYYSEVNSE
tara:strand:- start:159 stop:548 length:390 start_codon:yes stop_codon:yes gene_type:complete